MQDHNALTPKDSEWTDTRGLDYAIQVAGGTYHVWLRRWVPEGWGLLLGRSESDSAWIGVDDEAIGGIFDNEDGVYGEWSWRCAGHSLQLTPGRHILNLRIREGGYAVDRILLTPDADYVPSGAGPAETL